jgi:hypothetical protein
VMDYDRLMAQARTKNRRRDASDRRLGLAAPSDATVAQHLQTAMAAIKAGIATEDWSIVAEGQALLEEVSQRIRS